MLPLTRCENKVFTIIKEYIEQNGYSPSVRDIVEIYGVSSPATIHFFLRNLKNLGYINYIDGKSRTIRVQYDGEVEIKKYKYEEK